MFRLASFQGWCLVLLVLVSQVKASEGQEKTVDDWPAVSKTWDIFTVSYPKDRWTIEEEGSDNRMTFKLTSTVQSDVCLQLAFINGLPTEDDPKYDENPHMASLAALLPIAEKVAGGDQSKIIVTVGLINLPEYWDTSARVSVLLDDGSVLNMESGHFLVEEEDQTRMAIAILYSKSQRGQVNDSPQYPEVFSEAYSIIQGIEYPQLEEDDDED